MSIRLHKLVIILFAAFAAVGALGVDRAGAQDGPCIECGPEVTGEVDHGVISVRLNGSGNVVASSSNSAANPDCSYWPSAIGLAQGEGEQFILLSEEGIVSVGVAWECLDGEPSEVGAEGEFIVELADAGELALLALDDVPFPELEILTFPDTEVSIISGFEIPLLLADGAGTTFETSFEATAEDNGFFVTATATARTVEWDTSPINAQFGYGDEQFFECDTFGEEFMPSALAANPCVVRWRGSSSGQVDNVGTAHRISLLAGVIYDIEYTATIGLPAAFGEPEFILEVERNGVPVNEIQVLHVSR